MDLCLKGTLPISKVEMQIQHKDTSVPMKGLKLYKQQQQQKQHWKWKKPKWINKASKASSKQSTKQISCSKMCTATKCNEEAGAFFLQYQNVHGDQMCSLVAAHFVARHILVSCDKMCRATKCAEEAGPFCLHQYQNVPCDKMCRNRFCLTKYVRINFPPNVY